MLFPKREVCFKLAPKINVTLQILPQQLQFSLVPHQRTSIHYETLVGGGEYQTCPPKFHSKWKRSLMRNKKEVAFVSLCNALGLL